MTLASYRILLTYNIHPSRHETYYRYMLGEFIPILQKLNLRMLFAWHVHSETHPQRQVEFVCADIGVLRSALNSEEFRKAEEHLLTLTTSYSRKVVRFENRFQF